MGALDPPSGVVGYDESHLSIACEVSIISVTWETSAGRDPEMK
jgi:hypothetical protein